MWTSSIKQDMQGDIAHSGRNPCLLHRGHLLYYTPWCSIHSMKGKFGKSPEGFTYRLNVRVPPLWAANLKAIAMMQGKAPGELIVEEMPHITKGLK